MSCVELFEKCYELGIETLDTSRDRLNIFTKFVNELKFDKFTGATAAGKQSNKDFFEQNGVPRD